MSRDAGYSILEIVFSFAILGIAGIGLFYVATTTATATTRSRDQASAAALAVTKLEELKNTPFADLVSGSDGPLEPDGTAGGVFSRAWSVTAVSPSGVPARDLAVTVTWDGSKTLTFRTLVVDPPEAPVDGAVPFVQSWNQVK